MAQSHKFNCKTEQKINCLLPVNYRSLTQIKHRQDAPLINAEILTACENQEGCKASVSPDFFRDRLFQLIGDLDTTATASLANHLHDWMGKRWTTLKMHLSSRFNKLQYLCPSLVNQTFANLEKEILLEWKKNNFLQGFQLLSSYTFTSHKFGTLQEIQQFYNHIRTIISQITYLLFQPCLQHLLQQNFSLQHKLYNYTAVTIITSSREWPSIAERVIKPHFLRNCPSFSQNFNIKELDAPAHLIDPESTEKLFTNTAESIKKLDQSYSPSVFIPRIKEYRSSLIEQIQTSISSWRRKTNKAKQIVLEKEDILSCIIYSFVTHKIDNIGVTLKYLSFLYQSQLEAVLGSYQVDAFRVDLEVAYQYLTQPVVHLSIENLGKVESLSTNLE